MSLASWVNSKNSESSHAKSQREFHEILESTVLGSDFKKAVLDFEMQKNQKQKAQTGTEMEMSNSLCFEKENKEKK